MRFLSPYHIACNDRLFVIGQFWQIDKQFIYIRYSGLKSEKQHPHSRPERADHTCIRPIHPLKKRFNTTTMIRLNYRIKQESNPKLGNFLARIRGRLKGGRNELLFPHYGSDSTIRIRKGTVALGAKTEGNDELREKDSSNATIMNMERTV